MAWRWVFTQPDSTDDPQLSTLSRRLVANHAELRLKPLDLALLGFLLGVGVALLDLRLVGGLLAQVGDGEAMAEHVIATKLQLGLAIFRQLIANFDQLSNELVERSMIVDVDELFDSS